ncbi:MAG TPA: hypothetical protein VGD71_20930 [Kribbella sp.]|jgi:hypothetical protein
MSQLEDEDLVMQVAATLFPHQVDRFPDVNGLRLWVDGDPLTPEEPADEARAIFQTSLGVLRTWRPGAGELEVERLRGLGAGTIQDRARNQWGTAAAAVTYSSGLGELASLITCAARALPSTDRLGEALWLLGRAHPDAAEFFMIFEYAGLDPLLGGSEQLMINRLGFSTDWARDFRRSAHNLAPKAGGRHAKTGQAPPWNLTKLREATAELLRRWIRYVGEQAD